MDDLERIVQSAARGFAEGLLLRLSPPLEAPKPKHTRRRAPRASTRTQPPLPQMEHYVPIDPRSPMDDYEQAVPSAAQLDAMFAGADPENEQIQALRRQMELQRVAAGMQPQKATEPPPVTSWGVSDQ